MCLAVPARLMQVQDDQAVADLHGNRVTINTALVPDAKVGDWVLMHAGFAIQKLDEDEAQQTFAVLEDLSAAAESGGAT